MKFMWITVAEAAARMGINARRINYLIDKGKIEHNNQKGVHKRIKWTGAKDDDNEVETLEEAKCRKMIADANLAELKNIKEKKRQFDEWSELFMAQFATSFGQLKNLVAEIQMKPKQAKEINGVFGKCLVDLQDNLKNISNNENL
jgi:hypothetical protein